jgi:hypothetical protein
MIAAITLASVVGTWSCVVRSESPRSVVSYTLLPSHTGSYAKRQVAPPIAVLRHFTFEFFGGREEASITEHIVETGSSPFRELHSVHFSGRRMVDRAVGYWRDDGEFAMYPTHETLECVR